MTKKLIVSFSIILLISSVAAFAQSEKTPPPGEPEDPGFTFALGLTLGYSSFGDDESYQKLGLRPDFGYGKFGLGLALDLHYRFVDGVLDFRSEDWVPDAEHSFFDIYLPIFRYIRYGQKGEPIFAKIGAIEDLTLGNGFIMYNYSNALFLPETRITGLAFDLDGRFFDFPLIGFETVIGNLAALDVMGARFYIRPMYYLELPILPMLQVGASYVIDRAPFKWVTDTYAAAEGFPDPDAEYVDAFGIDFIQPILTQAPVTFAFFGDFVWQNKGSSVGGMTGFGGKLIDIFVYNVQARFVGENFIPVYFDQTYDISRAVKYPLIENGSSPGFVGWYASLGTNLFDLFILTISVDGPFAEVDAANPDNYLNYPHLRGVLTLKEGPLAGFSADLVYDKTLLGHSGDFFGDLVDPEGALTTVKLHYSFGPAIITLLYEIRYVPDAVGDPWVITSGLESSVVIPF
ncbi:MAG: hypothetical protein JW904_01025 [Spirochaetales bacterium]|nr:hypothetical protein [Spirochaetales bacterium]